MVFEMVEYLVEKMSEVLSKGDILELFKELEKVHGSVSKVCQLAGIERKTFYHWSKAREIKKETRVKIIRLALQSMPLKTLEFLIDKSLNLSIELLSTLFQFLFEKAVSNPESTSVKYYNAFRRIYKKYDVSLIDPIRSEVHRLLKILERRFEHKSMEISISSELRIELAEDQIFITSTTLPTSGKIFTKEDLGETTAVSEYQVESVQLMM